MHKTVLVLFAAFFCSSIAQAITGHDPKSAWIIRKDHWSPTDEKNYSNFIATLGTAQCYTVDSCIKSPANPYRITDPVGVTWTADCADFPYFLRAYFAWKNSLPFSYVNVIRPIGDSKDSRYSPKGNLPVNRQDITHRAGHPNPLAPAAIATMLDDVDSGMLRIPPAVDDFDRHFPDFYPVAINREAIHPGTVVYDPNGHVAIIYKIEDDGRIRYFDAHPDHSVSHGIYGEKFARSRPDQGAGFKNWRPISLLDAKKTETGELLGGHDVGQPNSSLADFSLEQFYGNRPSTDGRWRHGQFVLNNPADSSEQGVDYYDFVRARLAQGNLTYQPVDEMVSMMDALCQDLRDRVLAVQAAVENDIQKNTHPVALPDNIYGTEGEWESFATPSRDARLRTSFVELRKNIEKFVTLFRQDDPRIRYTGGDLAGDLRTAYDNAAARCSITYTNSKNVPVTLSYQEITDRLFLLSFDPYHCPELRWGAHNDAELASCPDDADKRGWFEAEQNLRNQIERRYDVKMGFTLQDLQAKVRGSGVRQSPDVGLKGYLDQL